MTERQTATWRGVPAWQLAGGRLQVMVVPQRGAKITHLFDLDEGREWLAPAPPVPVRPLTYGSLYAAYEQCGWDDAFPTYAECAYPGAGRQAGLRLPDHGEVWSREWVDHSGDGDSVVLSIAGVALPYRLRKVVRVDDAVLTVEYELANEGDEPMPYLFLGHPMLSKRMVAELRSGDGWVLAVDDARPCWVRFAWDSAALPQRVDLEGGGHVDWVVYGPATSPEPDLESAHAAGHAPVLDAGATVRWTITATVGSGRGPT